MSGFSLYLISNDYLAALDALTGDVDIPPEAIADTMDGIEGEWSDKALNVGRYIRNLEAEADAISVARKAMDDREKAAKAKADRLRAYLLSEIERTGLKAKAPDLAITTAKNPPRVIIEDEDLIPCEYKRSVTTETIDKTAIKTALQSGGFVPGSRVEQSTRLVIK